MQKEKKQSQLLSTLSEILKLYHKYLLYSLRQDLLLDRKNGMLENIRDRIKTIIEKYGQKDQQSTPSPNHALDDADDFNIEKYDSKLFSRFLARLNEKIKGYMDQYNKDQVPEFLNESMKAIQKTSHNLKLADLLARLFEITNHNIPTKTKKEERKNSSLYSLMEFTEKRTAKSSTVIQVLIPEKALKAEDSKTSFLSAYTRKSNMIQQLIKIISIIQLDEKDLRRKCFAVQQILTQQQSQSQNNIRPLHTHYEQSMPTYSNFSTSSIPTTPFTPKQNQSDSSPILSATPNLIVTNSTQYMNYPGLSNNQVYLDMMDRNKTIGHMIKKYETYYDKYKKRQHAKIEKSRQREKDRERMKQRSSMPTIHAFDYNAENVKTRLHEQAEESRNLSLEQHNYTSPQKDSKKILKKITSRQFQEQIGREIYRQILNQNCSQKQKQWNGETQQANQDSSVENSNQKGENSSFPELKTVKFQYSVQPNNLSIYNLNTKNNLLSKKAEKLLKIIKPTLNPTLSETKNQRKQKSISTSALGNLNPITSHIKNINTYTQTEININLQLNSRQHQSQDPNNTAQFILSANTYNNLNSIVRSKQLLNRLLNKVAGSTSAAEIEGSVICLNKLHPEGQDKDKKVDSFDEIGTTAYGDHNWKHNRGHNSQDYHTNSLHRGKKPLLYRQELMERRAKAEAMYNKSRPTQIGSLRSNISFPKMEEFEAPSFLMACRSYQRTTEANANSKSDSKNNNRNIN